MNDIWIAETILDKAKTLGASLAGIVGLDDAAAACIQLPRRIAGPTTPLGSVGRGLALVLALAHGTDQPELDWWGGPGGTEGNRRLQEMSTGLKRTLAEEHGIRSHVLPYDPWRGGILLKNAAALAGLGAIGANNLLVTPQYGPRVRLRAMWVDLEYPEPVEGCSQPAGSVHPEPVKECSPCEGCSRPCWQACPQDAFASGAYDRSRCTVQMEQDEARTPVHPGRASGVSYVEYCRACELACPVGT